MQDPGGAYVPVSSARSSGIGFDFKGSAGAILGAAGDFLTGWKQNRIAQEAMEIDEQNLRWQQEAYDQSFKYQQGIDRYNRQLQSRIFAREDNSIQRRIEDLRKAGLSGVLAAGQGARAGAPVGISGAQRQPAQRSGLGIGQKMEAMGKIADISRTFAEISLIESQVKRNRTITPLEAQMMERQIESIILDNKYLSSTLGDRQLTADYLRGEAYWRKYIAKNNASLTHLDARWQSAFYNWAKDNSERKGYLQMADNPVYQEFLAVKAAATIASNEANFWNSLNEGEFDLDSRSLVQMLMRLLK